MTLHEANTVARIATYAHGGCPECTEALLAMLARAFPEFKWLLHDQRVVPEPEDLLGPWPARAESNLQ